MKIGFLGIGIMGRAMAANLLKAGFEVMVYNRNMDKCSELKDMGARVAATPREAAQFGEAVIFMLTGPEAIDACIFGDEGTSLAQAGAKIYVNMSTVSPAYSAELNRKLKNLGISFVDAPVSGSKKPAEDGTLVILAGGEKEVVDGLAPVFLGMGRKVVYCGEAGLGSMMKMSLNMLLGIMMEGLAETVEFGRKGGLDDGAMYEAVLAGAMSCGLFALKENLIKQNVFPPQFPLKHMAKDLNFVAETAMKIGCEIPVGKAVLREYSRAMEAGLGDEDFSAVIKILK